MDTKRIPNFTTLPQLPSWCNQRGRVDRSACVEVRIGEVRRLCGSSRPTRLVRDVYTGRLRSQPRSFPLPNERPAPSIHGRIATGIVIISAIQVHQLHQSRQPRQLNGDFRTARAHAMRPLGEHGDDDPARAGQRRDQRGVMRYSTRLSATGRRDDPSPLFFDEGLDGNPNKGAVRTKQIGLFDDWSQPLRIEKWIAPSRRHLPCYFFVCPGPHLARSEGLGVRGQGLGRRGRESGALVPPPSEGGGQGVGEASSHRAGSNHAQTADPRLPPLTRCKPGRKVVRRSASGSFECPQRTYKLMMVQCTPAESRDALLAQHWIDSLPPPRRRAHQDFINQLIARYGPLFEPRVLLCPRCLGVAYGNHPESNRQWWRQRHGKPTAADVQREFLREKIPQGPDYELILQRLSEGLRALGTPAELSTRRSRANRAAYWLEHMDELMERWQRASDMNMFDPPPVPRKRAKRAHSPI